MTGSFVKIIQHCAVFSLEALLTIAIALVAIVWCVGPIVWLICGYPAYYADNKWRDVGLIFTLVWAFCWVIFLLCFIPEVINTYFSWMTK